MKKGFPIRTTARREAKRPLSKRRLADWIADVELPSLDEVIAQALVGPIREAIIRDVVDWMRDVIPQSFLLIYPTDPGVLELAMFDTDILPDPIRVECRLNDLINEIIDNSDVGDTDGNLAQWRKVLMMAVERLGSAIEADAPHPSPVP